MKVLGALRDNALRTAMAHEAHPRIADALRADETRVLIVDDDEDVREHLALVLRASGYAVRTAADGAEALRTMEQGAASIVLSDYIMPNVDGIELCRALRSRQMSGYTYVIMLSVRDGAEDVIQGLNAGADDYVSKRAPRGGDSRANPHWRAPDRA